VHTSAPLPQDVHPNAYQATGAVGPPGPQWGNSAPQPGHPGPQAGPAANGWANRLAEINPPPQPPNPYDQREAIRGPPPPPPRQQSPRQEQQMRPYQDPPRHAIPHRIATPPRDHHAPAPYPGQGLPQLPPQPSQQPGQPSQQQRVINTANYAVSTSGVLPPAPNGMNGPAQGPMPPYGRGNSPRPEVRPIMDNRMPSPKSGYPHQGYQQHHPDSSNPGGIANGAPPPAAALAAAEAAANERAHERPGSVGPKRMRDWEEETSPIKKAASDENRARMEDMHHRRPSTPPRDFRRSSSEARRAEEQRRANENYHPSEAAHHPHTHSLQPHLPPMQPATGPTHEQQPPQSASKDYTMDERERERDRLEYQAPAPPAPQSEPERAARKMDVDEDYDDEGEDEKKGGIVSGSGPGSTTGEGKNTPPSAGSNGHTNGLGMNGQVQPKVEASA
jgi:general transcriptional corepressor CYC8